MAQAMTLIRRCLMLIIFCGLATPSQAQINSPTFPEPVFTETLVPLPETINRSDLKTASEISDRFKVPRSLALDIVRLAGEHASDTFPTKADILAMIEIESVFRPNAKYRDCFGLMMIQKKSHTKKLRKGESLMDVEVNMRIGTDIMKEYYELLNGNRKGTILALNAGVGNYLKKRYNSKYLSKFMRARANYA